MSIFQKSVLNKHLRTLDKDSVNEAYKIFKNKYSLSRILKIKELKEEEYQDGFLRDVFVDVLGYTLKPEDDFNLEREFKNQNDGKKADGAIIKNGNAIAVIELKSTNTKDLTKVTQQAFNYKNNQPECRYVITSNFQKLRFYVDYANEYEEFDLFNLTEKEFEVFYLILSKESILSDLPLKIKEETKFHEQNISEKLYKDYSNFKRKLFENLIKNNPDIDKLTLFKKSQKLIDRFLFILFAEDSGLLPPNSISRVIERYYKLIELDAEKPLYDIFKQYFGYMNIGREGKTRHDDIPAYNGGLFYEDKLLDSLIIDDEVLIDDLKKLSEYDFNTEVDVNILGHIFENSLNEIEEITAEIEGVAVDKSKSKRKKDGVFYTPKYITQYIVENTVGKLCNEKRKELDIEEIEFDGTYRTKDNKLSVKGEKLYKKLKNYKEWLHDLKIVDPACGSGAFLNQSLNFLIKEHKIIDDIIAELTNTSLRLFDVDKSILENNLFGVDINEESVEIAKLSLWLRTARKDRKLSSLNNNIKCGNSLIDEPEIAGDKAFDWNKEFKEIMESGGFDVVIGNPPYFSLSTINKTSLNYLKVKYKNRGDIYCIFYELGINILKPNGLISYITSNQWLQAQYGKVLRDFFVNNSNPLELVNFKGFKIFKDATVDSSILIARKEECKYEMKATVFLDNFLENEDIQRYIDRNYIVLSNLKAERWLIASKKDVNLKEKIFTKGIILKKHNIKILRGILTGFNQAFIINTKTKEELCRNNHKNLEVIKPLLRGRDIHRYSINWNGLWLINIHNGYKNVDPILIDNYPEIKQYLNKFFNKLEKRYDKGITPYNLRNCAYVDLFVREKIIYPETTVRRSEFYRDKGKYFIDKTAFMIIGENLGFYQSVLASKLMQWYLEFDLRSLGKNSMQYSKIFMEKVPIPFPNKILIEEFSEKSEIILNSDSLQLQKKNIFLNRVKDNLDLEKLSKKLDSFYNFDFKTFISELKKQKIKLSLTQQDEWEDYFNLYKTEINQLQDEINQTDKEIDQMVYKLYGLTDEEIRIVEESVG